LPLLDLQTRRKPVITALSSRPTFILRQPLVQKLRFQPSFRTAGRLSAQAALPPGVSREDAIKVVQESWGKKVAAGIADRAGLTGTERDHFIESWSRVVAEGLLD